MTYSRYRTLIGLAITILFSWLLLRQLDWATLRTVPSVLSIPLLGIALGFLIMGYSIRIFRWWWMLRALEPQLPLQACFWPFVAGIAVNNLLPLRAGDVYRILGFRQHLHSPASRLFGTLLIERWLDLTILLLLFFIGLLATTPAAIPKRFTYLAAAIAGICIVLILAVWLFVPHLHHLTDRIAANPFLTRLGWGERLHHFTDHLTQSLLISRNPRLTGQLLLLSLLGWGFEGAVFAVVAEALASGVNFPGAWFALATGTLATLLPSSPGYFGTFDYFTMRGLIAYGARPEMAAVTALIIHLVLWIPITLVGISYFLLPKSWISRTSTSIAPESPRS